MFALGVGDRGVPLSPDTIVLPSTVEVLPEAVLMAALRVLGQAWSVATAPAGTLPQGVTSVSKGAVFARATDLAEAGFRVQIGEPIERALQTLAFLWVNTESTGFEQVIRETNAGEAFQKAVGESLSAPGFIDDFQRQISQNFATQPSHILVGVGDGTGAAPINWQVSDGVGRTLQVGGESTLQNAAFIPLAEIDPVEPGRGLTLVTRLSSTLYEVRWVAAGDGALDLVLTLPRPEGVGLFVFSGVAVESGVQGKVELDLLRSTSTLTLGIDRDGDGIFEETVESAPAEILSSGGPELLAATAIGPETLNGADPWGRVVAILFDREVRQAEAELTSSYRVEGNEILAAIRQLSGRLVFLFLRDPVGEIVPRQVTVSGIFDVTGEPMVPSTVSLPITSRLVDPGAIVSGRVLRADGTPLSGAEVFYLNFAFGTGLIGISAKEVEPDGSYSFDYVRQSPAGPFAIKAVDPETGSIQELTTSVRANGERIRIDLVMLGRGGVTGTVRDVNADPVPGAQVLVTSQVDPSSFFLTEFGRGGPLRGDRNRGWSGRGEGGSRYFVGSGVGKHSAGGNLRRRRRRHQPQRRSGEWRCLRVEPGARSRPPPGPVDRGSLSDPEPGRRRATGGKR